MNWLLSLMLLASPSLHATENINPNSEQIECNQLLDECAAVVDLQTKAIIAQTEVIQKQEEIIEAKDDEIEVQRRGKETATGIAIVEGLLLILLHVL